MSQPDSLGEDPGVSRAAELSALGLRRRLPAGAAANLEAAAHDDLDPRARAAAVGALVRVGGVQRAQRAWRHALDDEDALVRRRVADLAPLLASRSGHGLIADLLPLLSDSDTTVVVATAWALGESGSHKQDATELDEPGLDDAVTALATVTTGHEDAIAREAAVAALGALGHPAGLEAILAACTDKPTVRRRAVLALAPFEGAAVDAALAAASEDKDWQVRQAAEDLLAEPEPPE